jgi:hypothetical protein
LRIRLPDEAGDVVPPARPDEQRDRPAQGVAAAVGPILGGVLTQAFGGRTAVLACAGGIAVATVFATASPSLRRFQGARAPGAEEVPAGTT